MARKLVRIDSKSRLEDILCPVDKMNNNNHSLYARINHHNTLLAYKELQYGLVQSFVSIHGPAQIEDIPQFNSGDVRKLLCADNFCYITVYDILMAEESELYKVKGLGRTRLDRVFNAINSLAGFDVISTLRELRAEKYEMLD